jgi:two-component system, NarL family, invasion response regulator UvrY
MSERPGQEPSAGAGTAVSRRVTVLAVDDQEVFLRVARDLIGATEGFELVGEAASGPEALWLAAELHPDLILLDVRMPGMDGIETARRLVADGAPPVIVLISLEPPADLPASLGSAGAAAYVRKQELSPRTLRDLWSVHGEPDR